MAVRVYLGWPIKKWQINEENLMCACACMNMSACKCRHSFVKSHGYHQLWTWGISWDGWIMCHKAMAKECGSSLPQKVLNKEIQQIYIAHVISLKMVNKSKWPQ